jgi:TetR/AcrR family transcriptional repressor of nem operon
MPRPRQTDDKALLAKAMPLFWRQGYTATGLRELEAALGLKAPAIYNRFGSKEGLFRQVLEHYLHAIVGRRITLYLQAEDPLAGLRRFFETTYDYAKDGLPPLACLIVNTATELGGSDAHIGEVLRRSSALVTEAFRQNLARAQARGLLRKDADIGTEADLLHISLQGLLVISKIERDHSILARKVDLILARLPHSPGEQQ